MTRSVRYRRVRLAALFVPLSLLAVACGGDDDDGSSSDQVAAEATVAGPEGTDVPATDDIDREAVIRYATDLEGGIGVPLDPARFKGNYARPVMDGIYGTMFRRTPEGPVPSLATAVDSPDEQTVVVTLREGVTFHDGTPFNAEAVKFAWDRVIAAPQEQMLKGGASGAMTSVEVLDEYTVQVNLDQPLAYSFRNVFMFEASSGLGVPSPTALQERGDEGFLEHPVGAGPLEFVSYQPGQPVVLKKYDGYWDPETYRFGGLEVYQVAKGAPRITALASDEVDLADIYPADVEAAEAQGFEVVSQPIDTRSTAYLDMCSTRPPFDNALLREAVITAINPDEIVASAFSGQAIPNRLYRAPTDPLYAEELADDIQFDPERARELVADSGVATPLAVQLRVVTDPTFTAAAEVIQSELADIDIDVEIVPTDNLNTDNIAAPTDMWINPGTPLAIFNFGHYGTSTINYCKAEVADTYAASLPATSVLSTPEEAAAADQAFQELMMRDNRFGFFATLNVSVAHDDNVSGLGYIFAGPAGVDSISFADVYVAK